MFADRLTGKSCAERLRTKDQEALHGIARYRDGNQKNPMGETNLHRDFASSLQSTEEESNMSVRRFSRVSRRRFLKQTGVTLLAAGSAPLLSAPFVSTAMADTKSLSIVQWSHFVPAYDKWFDAFAKD